MIYIGILAFCFESDLRLKLYKIAFSALVASVSLQSLAEEQNNDNDLGIMLDTLTVTASRQEKKKLEVPETVDIITKKQIDEQGITNMQDLVRHIPGVSVDRQTSGTDPFGNLGGIRIRGVSGNRIQMQVDGSRVIESIQDGNRNFIDLSTIKAVEIVRGPGSVLWGADALGGVVAFRTLDPSDLLKDKSYAAQLSGGYNSLNKQKTKTGIFAAAFSPNVEGFIAISRRDYEEARLSKAKADGGIWGCPRGIGATRCNKLNPLDAEAHNMLSKLVLHADNHEVKLTGEKFRSNSYVNQLYDHGIQKTGMFSYNGDYLRTQIQERTRLAIEDIWVPHVSFLDQVKTMLSYSPQKRYVKSYRHQINKSGKDIYTFSTNDYREKFWQADLQFTSIFKALSTEHELIYGFQGDITKTDSQNKNIDGKGIDYNKGFNFANAKTRRADVYFQDEIKLVDGRLKIKPGIRYATYKIEPRIDRNPKHYDLILGKEPRKLESKRFIPQLGAVFNLTHQYSLYARYSEGFKMPTAQQLYTSRSMPMMSMNLIPNPDLKAEKVKSYEAGVRGEFTDGWFSFGGFRADYRDYIKNLVQINPTDYTYQNLSKVNIWGLEASGEWQFLPNWSVNAAASYQYGKQKQTANSKTEFFNDAMPLEGSLGVKWVYPELNFQTELVSTLSKGVTRTSKKSETNGKVFKPSGYAIYDAYFNWNATKNLTLRASVQNILDRRYFKWPLFTTYYENPASSSRATNPLELQTAPGRSFSVDVVVNF